jgi:hypothetical protein
LAIEAVFENAVVTHESWTPRVAARRDADEPRSALSASTAESGLEWKGQCRATACRADEHD